MSPDLVAFLQRHAERFDAILQGRPFTFEGTELPVRAVVVPDEVARQYEDLGQKLGLDPATLGAVLFALGGEVLRIAVEQHATTELEVTPGEALN